MAVTLANRASGTYANNTPIPSGTNSKDVSNREDLANFISMITRDETPFMSSIGKTKATSIYHEWQTDELETPGNSRITEGLDYAAPGDSANSTERGDKFNVSGPDRSRLGNYCQINGKSMAISGTRRVIDQAGVADEYAYQLKKRGTELRRDVEHDLIHSYNVASGSGIRTMGGYSSWINSEDTVQFVGSAAQNSVSGSDYDANRPGQGRAGFNATTTAGEATKGALALSDVDEVMQKIYEQGGKATRIMVSPKLRRDFSDLMVTDTGVRRNLDEKGKLRQSVDVYMSDFGDIMVVPNYIMGLSNVTSTHGSDSNDTDVDVKDYAALIYDPQWFSMATLRPLQEVDVGQRGDSTIGMMVEEFTLEVKNPLGCGAIYGLE